MTWEHLITDILEAFPRLSDIILSENGDYCVLSNGAAHKLKLPECLRDSWPDLMMLLFPNRFRGQDLPLDEKTFTLEGAITLAGSRFRLSALKHSQGSSVVMRLLPYLIPKPGEIELYPSVVERFKKLDHGLVLLIGPTGSGKSTTIASLIQERMSGIPENIITIEDPIEYVYQQDSVSNIFQREVGRDCESFGTGLRDALRQAPHLIMIGEIRDEETALTALKAAESGHVVVSTVHAHSVDQACLRFIKLLANYNPENVCDALAGTLQMALAQTLVFNPEIKRRVSLHEVMFMTSAIAAHIRNQKFERIPNELTIGSRRGQISWARSVEERISLNLLPPDFEFGNRLAS